MNPFLCFIKYNIRKTVYPILCRFRKKVPFDLLDRKVSKPTCLSEFVRLPCSTAQGEIELLPLISLKFESDFLDNIFWQHFRVSCHALKVGDKVAKVSHIYIFFGLLLLWDYLTQEARHAIRFTLYIVSCSVSSLRP